MNAVDIGEAADLLFNRQVRERLIADIVIRGWSADSDLVQAALQYCFAEARCTDAVRIYFRQGNIEEAGRTFALGKAGSYGQNPPRSAQYQSRHSDERCRPLPRGRRGAAITLSLYELFNDFATAASLAEDMFGHLRGMREQVQAYRKIADFYRETETEPDRIWQGIVGTGRIVL